MRRIAVFFAALAALPGLAFAQSAPVSNPTGLLPTLTLEAVAPLFAEAGFSVRRDGQYLVINVSGRTVVAEAAACRSANDCDGLFLYAIANSRSSAAVAAEFNRRQRIARSVYVDETSVALDRYLIGDFGVARGSVVVDVYVLASMLDNWFQYNNSQSGVIGISAKTLEADDEEIERLKSVVAFARTENALNGDLGEGFADTGHVNRD
ncbi:MAG: hypothetical protein AAFR11_12205 [Pseudomonadota bacterium]